MIAMASRLRPCLYHDMGRCLAPCTGRVDQSAYAAMVQRVEMLLSGRSRELLHALRQEMMSASDALEFEKAAALRDQIRAVEQTVEKQHVVLNDGGDMDVAGVSAVCGGLGLGLRRGGGGQVGAVHIARHAVGGPHIVPGARGAQTGHG